MNPIGLDDLMAWVLFLVTMGFGIAAMVDGLFIDDLYPGYGDISRRAKAAVDEFEEEFEEVCAELEDIKQENMDALDAEIIKANQLLIRFSQQLDDKKAIYKSWAQKLNDSEVVLTPRCAHSDPKMQNIAMTRCCRATLTPSPN